MGLSFVNETSSGVRGAFSAAILAAGLMSGCASDSLVSGVSLPSVRPTVMTGKPVAADVNRVLCLWEPSEGVDMQGKPARGFAGQLLFFGPGEESPRAVDGQLIVYQYDNYDPAGEAPEPLHEFRFDASALASHRVESTLGETYNMFIPYVADHGQPTNCALRVEYVGENGERVGSGMTEVLLTARRSQSGATPLHRGAVKRLARGTASSAEQELPGVASEKALESLTIPLPRR